MGQIKGLLFDKDGTILDFYRTWVPINRMMALDAAGGDVDLAAELLRASGHDPDTDFATPGAVLVGADASELAVSFADFLKERAPPNLLEIIARNFREGGAKYATLIDGATEELARLGSSGYRLGLATNDTFDGLEASLGRFGGLLEMFEFRVGCDSGHGAKPEPGMGLAFAKVVGLEPSACAIIGDSTHDLEMGRRAGFGLCVGVLTGPSRRADLEPHADIVIDSILDLANVLNERSAAL
ncbi:HAD family hydrolase [Hyphomicrobium sp.]|uniref:HAD family hydrolase n=1 Tax=Hyphomicrobium sp. TaxID=82 RepID=UPI001DD501A5|nr:HAD family hydrolase [Hyphomicrobium sp.]MBY0562337.1 HAD family hydrolase [Hyphomicrobium sp.]